MCLFLSRTNQGIKQERQILPPMCYMYVHLTCNLFVLPDWEGFAHDSHVLRDAIFRPNGLKVPQDGVFVLYSDQRYHLSEWKDVQQPYAVEEYFNMNMPKQGMP